MSVQHKSIPDAQLHEPKGAISALAKQVYVSDGLGSGTWQIPDSTTLKGLVGDAGVAGKKLLTNGSNGFTMVTDTSYGVQAITANSTPFPVTAVADTSFNTASQFSLFTGVGAPWTSENLYGTTFSIDHLIVSVTGVYDLNFWATITGFPSNTARIAVRYRINAGAFSLRKPTIKSAVASDSSQIVGSNLVPLTAGDSLHLYIASDTTGNIVMSDANLSLQLVRQTA